METKQIYTEKDCAETGLNCTIKGKVVVLRHDLLPDNDKNQLYFCLPGNGAGANPEGSNLFLASLRTGEFSLKNRNDVLGVLKPEMLPEQAKLQLSQIRPVGALDLKAHEPEFSGYSFLPDGRYAAGVWLCSGQEVMDYVEMQKPYQYRIMICDMDDFCVMEISEGKLIYPSQEELEAFRGPEGGDGGIKMT